ncbi:MAG TPA: cupredoxin domain-containing protein [Baekduia sp.]|uniref:cupredoxin domain-containing protein n=1 Tax=Baekduia sp. TaxID=2600305 RepID=UPI002B98D844|nr:cupredoxin domain-containing protein [Baekduia sp.]HMJ32888.1 cupredoxin domain-containing protein [Baekduia sp.]
MHPGNVAGAASLLAAAPSKAPFYVVGAALAAWAVALAAFGATHPEFPHGAGGARLVVLTTVLLVAGAMTAAVLTAGDEGGKAQARPAGGAAPSSTLALAADPSGGLSYDVRQATVAAGADTIRFVNRSPLAHDVTIAQGSKVVAATKTIDHATTTTTARLAPGRYVFYCSVDEHRQAGMQGTLTVR